ncbi:MAG: ABC transporter permease [Marinicella sp.]
MMKLKIGLFSLVLLLVFIVLGPILTDINPETIHWDDMAVQPNQTYWFGTDVMGRDLYIRTLQGGQMSMLVAFVATFISVIIGVSYGVIAGYYGGKVDAVMMRIVDVLYALPFLFLVILLLVFFGQNIYLLFAAIGGYIWLDMARIVRGQTQMLKQQAFIESAYAIGQQPIRILLQHIVPNLLGVVIIYATLMIPQVILIESFLSFLGLGIQEPMTSWGALVSEGAENMDLAPWSLLIPALFLSLTLVGFNLLGDGLRDYMDPSMKNHD